MNLLRTLVFLGLMLAGQVWAYESPINGLIPRPDKERGPDISVVLWDDNPTTRQLFQSVVGSLLSEWYIPPPPNPNYSYPPANMDGNVSCWVFVEGSGPFWATLECTKKIAIDPPSLYIQVPLAPNATKESLKSLPGKVRDLYQEYVKRYQQTSSSTKKKT